MLGHGGGYAAEREMRCPPVHMCDRRGRTLGTGVETVHAIRPDQTSSVARGVPALENSAMSACRRSAMATAGRSPAFRMGLSAEKGARVAEDQTEDGVAQSCSRTGSVGSCAPARSGHLSTRAIVRNATKVWFNESTNHVTAVSCLDATGHLSASGWSRIAKSGACDSASGTSGYGDSNTYAQLKNTLFCDPTASTYVNYNG